MIPRFTLMCRLALLSLSVTTLTASSTRAQLVSTLAGTLTAGNADGLGTAASFNWPISVSLDKNKNIYLADAENHRIRKITPAGLVSTFVGSDSGHVDGNGTAAKLNHPLGVVLNDSGYVFVADSRNNMIRKVSPTGDVTTFAGTGAVGSANGAGNAATFNYPNGLAIDAAGNIYVADASNNMIRKITPAGVVSTVAGATIAGKTDGQDTLARFTYPTGIAIDAGNNLFVADENNHLIRKITAQGMVSTYAGSYADNLDDTGTLAAFNAPYGIAIDAANNLYIAEIGNNQIRKITPDKKVMTFAGYSVAGSDDGLGTSATFFSPTGIALDGMGSMFVGDWKNNLIRKIDLTVTGIFTARTVTQLHVYPNPTKDLINVTAKEGSQITIYNAVGTKVSEVTATSTIKTFSMKLLPAGIYSVVTLDKDGKKAYAKFVNE